MIVSGIHDDVIVGGLGSDTITASEGKNVVVGDHGRATFNATGFLRTAATLSAANGAADTVTTGTGSDIVFGGAGSDDITVSDGRNVVLGDHGIIEFDGAGQWTKVDSTDEGIGGNDTIASGDHADLIIGGTGRDTIISTDGDNVVIGDNASLTLNSAGELLTLDSSFVNDGDTDDITTGAGNDIVVAGTAGDTIDAANGDNVVIGDHAEFIFDGLGQFLSITSAATSIGGDDTITTGKGHDVAIGGFGQDALTLSDGKNVALGDNGSATFDAAGQLRTLQTLDAATGDADVIRTGVDSDIVLGGASTDDIDVSDGRNVVIGDHGAVLVDAAGQWTDVRTSDTEVGGDDSIVTGRDNDVVFGGAAEDHMQLGNGDNLAVGDNGRATFNAIGQLLTVNSLAPLDGGRDLVTTGAGRDIVIGGTADDTLTVGDGKNLVLGDHGELLLNGNGQWTDVRSSSDQIGGDDVITAGLHDDVVIGGFGNDRIVLSEGNNLAVGDNGQVTFTDQGEFLVANTQSPDEAGKDIVNSGHGIDVVLGGSDDDVVDVGNGRNVVVGDNGRITFDGLGQWLNVTTAASAIGGDDNITSGDSVDVVFGGVGDDVISLADGDNVAAGDNAAARFNAAGQILTVTTSDPADAGRDTINTGRGRDVVFGGTDDDTINVADGRNVVAGDNASATFDVHGQIRTVTTSDSTYAGNDAITSGIHDDLIFGGSGHDSVTAADGNNMILGDNGLAEIDAAGIVTRLQSLTPAIGGDDDIRAGAGQDLIIGGACQDSIRSGAGRDLIFGDNARVEGHLDLNSLPLNSQTPDFVFTSMATQASDNGGDDFILAGAGDDIAIGGQGNDTIVGDDGNDDLIGGHNIAGGHDGHDVIDGGTGHDVVAGDNASVLRNPRTADARWRVLSGTQIHSGDGAPLVTAAAQNDPDGVPLRDIILFDHTFSTSGTVYGHDDLAGGSGNDLMFGQLGDDAVQGDGTVLDASGNRTLDIRVIRMSVDDLEGSETDGDDYIEGGGGRDLIYGNLGQDDIVGGSSSMFGTASATWRPDAEDVIYGGSGTQSARNDDGHLAASGHARDADVILGDNGNIFRLVGINGTVSGSGYLRFTYDTYGSETVIPRAIQQLDYTDGQASDISLSDEIHGEAGDDIVWGMSGNDVLFGDGQDDDIVGGAGNDRIYGGTGIDGILGDDGRIFTSRNGLTETLHGLTAPNAQSVDFLPGTVVGAAHHLTGQLHKSVDLYSFHVGGHDVIYGGLGDDFIHGGAGDDAISGAEALDTHFHTILPSAESILGYNAADRMFADYNAADALARIDGFALNFDATDSAGNKIDDGVDRIFGDTGNDWIVGGTMNDRLFGGMGDDLLNADDNLSTNSGLNNEPDAPEFADADFAFGGGGYDVLIANTGADRLIDWSKRFNTYVVPIATTTAGAGGVSPTVIRDPQPVVVDFLITMAAASGADSDIDVETNEIHAELGLITVEDDQLWRDQLRQKIDRDPQPGNLTTGLDTRGSIESLPTAGILVTETSGQTVVVEGGASDSVMVMLSVAPTSNVLIHVLSADPAAVRADTSSLIFTPSNWFVPQFVTMTAVDNTQHHGDHAADVQFQVDPASDGAYQGLSVPSITVTCIDDEVAPPVLTAPVEWSSDDTPEFSWTAVPGATAYELWVNNLAMKSGPVIHEVVNGTSFEPETGLGPGTFRIWVRAVMAEGQYSGWSPASDLKIGEQVELTLPAQPVTIARPALTWNAVTGADHYELWVNNLTTGEKRFIHETEVDGTWFTPTADMPIGNYRVWVRGISASGSPLEWSAAGLLKVRTAVIPAQMASATFNTTPEFSWQPVAGATSYDVYLSNQSTKSVLTADGISGTSWTPDSALSVGSYRFWVRARGAAGIATWSEAVDVNIGGQPVVVQTSGSVIRWGQVDDAASYSLWINRLDVQGNVVNLTGLTDNQHTLSSHLTPGTYRVWVRAISATGQASAWSRAVDFTVVDAKAASEFRLVETLDALLAGLEIDLQSGSTESTASDHSTLAGITVVGSAANTAAQKKDSADARADDGNGVERESLAEWQLVDDVMSDWGTRFNLETGNAEG
ncbi:MAG: hypothetical protein RIK87_20275 [Fuerstiella sp.]